MKSTRFAGVQLELLSDKALNKDLKLLASTHCSKNASKNSFSMAEISLDIGNNDTSNEEEDQGE